MTSVGKNFALNLFGPCSVPASWVSRPAQHVLSEARLDPEASSRSSPQGVTPSPVFIDHQGSDEEPLNRHIAGRLARPLRPDTPLLCIRVAPDELNPQELIELVEFRFRDLEAVYHGQIADPVSGQVSDHSLKGPGDKDIILDVLGRLHKYETLRSLVLRHFFPEHKELSGKSLMDLLNAHREKRGIQQTLREKGMTLPWSGSSSGSTSSPARSPLEKARSFWEAFRSNNGRGLPGFSDACQALQRATSSGDNPTETGQPYNRILLDRLKPVHGQEEASRVIAMVLEETGFWDGKWLQPGQGGEQAPDTPQATNESSAEPGTPPESGESPDEGSAEVEEEGDPEPTADQADPAASTQLAPEEPADLASEEDELLFWILAITADADPPLNRSPDCWNRILQQAHKVNFMEGHSFHEKLRHKLKNPNDKDLKDILKSFLRALSKHDDLRC